MKITVEMEQVVEAMEVDEIQQQAETDETQKEAMTKMAITKLFRVQSNTMDSGCEQETNAFSSTLYMCIITKRFGEKTGLCHSNRTNVIESCRTNL